MKNIEVTDTSSAVFTSDYLLDMTWSEATIDPEPTSLSIAREKFESKICAQQPHKIESIHDYLFYIGHIIDDNVHTDTPTPHKALFQRIGATFGITEPTTRVVPTRDLSTGFSYGLRLLENHETIWIGTGAIDDHSDPSGRQDLNPPLYKNIRTKEDLIDALIKADTFEQTHPNSYLKIFPQDREKPAICSMVVSNNKQEGSVIHLKVRKGEYTTSERKAGDDKPILISLDLSGPVVKIITNQSNLETKYWLNIILNSRELFTKLDDIDLKGSDYINPEFLVFMNGSNTKVSFFTDCIWGSKNKTQKDKRCPKTSPLLNKLNDAIHNDNILIVPEKYSLGLQSYSDYMFTVLNTLKSTKSTNPDRQTALFILKSQEYSTQLNLPFTIPKLDEITLKSLWRICYGHSPSTTINVVAHLQNQLSITELPNSNIEYGALSTKFDRYLKRTLPIWLYKFSKQKYLELNNIFNPAIEDELLKIFRTHQISKKDAVALVKAIHRSSAKED